ncbi:MAG: MerR family transcriptional regulator [Chloroflexi bacterium]|jgi:MerR family transcriptional regulator/heat shock protein HspR|nr:MerR family transcriptional regulator [Chloroflexota bacterium]MDP6498661.1 MerR family transcriptional regulator [Dehalococcoidia bacterium]MQG53915.1 MerR family transcriptional regulator [SAR202 cluster bacterium]|tara:strand:- start:201 stop:575 length:375 start_codon:yes stop_codon:yes gene_type:complete
MSTDNQFRNEPCFVISVAARIVGVHAQTLRQYERVGLIWPSRTGGRQRLYSMADIERLRRLKSLTEDMGLNLAGAEVALKLMNRIEELEGEIKQLTEAVSILQRQELRSGQGQGQGASPVSQRQ